MAHGRHGWRVTQRKVMGDDMGEEDISNALQPSLRPHVKARYREGSFESAEQQSSGQVQGKINDSLNARPHPQESGCYLIPNGQWCNIKGRQVFAFICQWCINSKVSLIHLIMRSRLACICVVVSVLAFEPAEWWSWTVLLLKHQLQLQIDMFK